MKNSRQHLHNLLTGLSSNKKLRFYGIFLTLILLGLILSKHSSSKQLVNFQEPLTNTLPNIETKELFANNVSTAMIIESLHSSELDGTLVAEFKSQKKTLASFLTILEQSHRFVKETISGVYEDIKHFRVTCSEEYMRLSNSKQFPEMDAIDLEKMMAMPGYYKACFSKNKPSPKQARHLSGKREVNYRVVVQNKTYETQPGLNLIKTVTKLEDDAISEYIQPGFDFPFYGKLYSGFYISTNGFLSFDSSKSYCQPVNLPIDYSLEKNDEIRSYTFNLKNIIAWCWDDLYISGKSKITVLASSERCEIHFQDITKYGSRGALSAVITLEKNGKINIHYTHVSTEFETRSATVGMKGVYATSILPMAYNQPFIKQNLLISFVPYEKDNSLEKDTDYFININLAGR